MASPERAQVVDMVAYLRETLAQMDLASAWLANRRMEFALRLAAIEAATDPKVLDAAEEYEQRIHDDRPYEDAENADALLSEAYKRYSV